VARARSRAPRSREVRLVKISQLAELSGVPGPTIKHYLREGLLGEPARKTSRNMAYYDARLAERVKVIKGLQAERFLPLRLIGELLEPAPSATVRADRERAGKRQLGELAPAIRDLARAGRGLTRAQVLASLPITALELDYLARLGLVIPETSGGGEPIYRGIDAELLELLADIRRQGLGDVFPISLVEPYAAAVRAMIRIEIDMFRRRVLEGGLPLPRPVPEVATQAVDIGRRLLVGLRAKLLPPELEALAASAAPVEGGSDR
jgi:DNA-binding transcriptional MerR regulator